MRSIVECATHIGVRCRLRLHRTFPDSVLDRCIINTYEFSQAIFSNVVIDKAFMDTLSVVARTTSLGFVNNFIWQLCRAPNAHEAIVQHVAELLETGVCTCYNNDTCSNCLPLTSVLRIFFHTVISDKLSLCAKNESVRRLTRVSIATFFQSEWNCGAILFQLIVSSNGDSAECVLQELHEHRACCRASSHASRYNSDTDCCCWQHAALCRVRRDALDFCSGPCE